MLFYFPYFWLFPTVSYFLQLSLFCIFFFLQNNFYWSRSKYLRVLLDPTFFWEVVSENIGFFITYSNNYFVFFHFCFGRPWSFTVLHLLLFLRLFYLLIDGVQESGYLNLYNFSRGKVFFIVKLNVKNQVSQSNQVVQFLW